MSALILAEVLDGGSTHRRGLQYYITCGSCRYPERLKTTRECSHTVGTHPKVDSKRGHDKRGHDKRANRSWGGVIYLKVRQGLHEYPRIANSA